MRHFACDIGEAVIAATVAAIKFFVVDTQEVQNSCIHPGKGRIRVREKDLIEISFMRTTASAEAHYPYQEG